MLKVFEAVVHARHTVRRFSPASVAPDVLARLLALASRSPSSFNSQPWTCVVVDDEGEQRAALAGAMLGGNGRVVRGAPVSLVFAADTQPAARVERLLTMERDHGGASPQQLERMKHGIALFGGHEAHLLKRAAAHGLSPLQPMPTIHAPEAWAFKQTMPAVQTLLLGATAAGLATCPMEGFDGRRIAAALAIPDRFSVPVVVAMGHPQEGEEEEEEEREGGAGPARGGASVRLPLEEVFFRNAFGAPLAADQLKPAP